MAVPGAACQRDHVHVTAPNGAGDPLSGYWLSNLTATYRPTGSRFSIGASLYNLFDATYMYPVGTEFVQGAIAPDGRTAAARVTVRF